MLLTKDQAASTWCPMVRLASCHPNGDVQNGQTVMNRLQNGRNAAIPDCAMCIADKCAMWRWAGLTATGYCGLAGKPT